MNLLLLLSLALSGDAQADRRIHTDTCVKLIDASHQNLPHCPIKHLSKNPYTQLERSNHKYILLRKGEPIVLEVKGPGVGLRHLFLWKYKDGKVFNKGSYTVTIVRDGKEFVRKTMPIRVYPKHKVYGSAERMRTTMLEGNHRYEIRLESESEGEAIYYWKVGSIDGLYFHDDWKPLPK